MLVRVMNDVESLVRNILVNHFGVCALGLDSSMNFVEALRADSLDIISLAVLFEEAFDIAFDGRDLVEIRSIQSISDRITHKQAFKSNTLASIP